MALLSSDIRKFAPFNDFCIHIPKFLFGAMSKNKENDRIVTYFFSYNKKVYALEEFYKHDNNYIGLTGFEVTDFNPNTYSYFYEKTDEPNEDYVFDKIKSQITPDMEEYIKHIDDFVVYTFDLSGALDTSEAYIFGLDSAFAFKPIELKKVYKITEEHGFSFRDNEEKDYYDEDER